MKVMVDLNVLIDVLLERQPHYDHSRQAVAHLIVGEDCVGMIPVHGITTIWYVIRNQVSREVARKAIGRLVADFRVAPANEAIVHEALASASGDLEDAIVAVSASVERCDYILTRDAEGFHDSLVGAISPTTFVERFVG